MSKPTVTRPQVTVAHAMMKNCCILVTTFASFSNSVRTARQIFILAVRLLTAGPTTVQEELHDKTSNQGLCRHFSLWRGVR